MIDEKTPRTLEDVADDFAEKEVAEEIGKSIGVMYQEGEPLRAGEKEIDRDRHRWELDPASADDYAERSHHIEDESQPVLKMRHQHHEKRHE